MTTRVPTDWPFVPLHAARVGAAAAYPTPSGWNDALAYLTCRCKHVVGANAGMAARNGTTSFFYSPSPGAHALLVAVELNNVADGRAICKIGVAINGATGTALGVPPNQLDGATPRNCPTSATRRPPVFYGVFDVSALTAGTGVEVAVTVTDLGGATASAGLYGLAVYEVPRDLTAPETTPSTEPGLQRTGTFHGAPIVQGSGAASADAGLGLERVWHELDAARSKVKRYPVQLATVEDASAWYVTEANPTAGATFQNVTFPGFPAGGVPHLATRAKRLYTGGVDNQIKVRLRVNNGGSVSTVVRLVVNGSANNDFTVTGAGWQAVTGTLTLPTSDATNQEARITAVQMKISDAVGAKTSRLSALCLLDNET